MFLLVFLHFTTIAAAARQTSVTEVLNNAYATYSKGDVLSAVEQVEARLARDVSPSDRLELHLALAEFCVNAEQVDCLRRHLEEFAELAKSTPEPPLWIRDKFILAALFERYLSRDFAFFRDQGALTFAENLADPVGNLKGYIDFSLLSAWLQLQTGDNQRALQFALQAEGGLLRIDPLRNRYFAATRLSQLIALLYDAKDTVRAYNLLNISHNFILPSLPPDGPEAALHKIRSAAIFVNLGLTSNSGAEALEDALTAWMKLQVEARTKDHRLSWLSATLTGLYAAGGLADEAQKALRRNPYYAKRQEILTRGRFANAGEVAFAFSETLSKIAFGEPPDPAWLPLVAGGPDGRLFTEKDGDLFAEALMFEAILSIRKGPAETSRKLLKRAGKAVLERIGALEGRFRDGYALPSLNDKLVMELAMQADVSDGDDSHDMLIAGTQFLSRSLRDEIVENIGFVSTYDDVEWTVAAASLVKLNNALRRWEVGRFREWMTRTDDSDAASRRHVSQAILLQAGLQSFEEKRTEIKAHLAKLADAGAAAEKNTPNARFPTQANVQSALTENDAFVTIVYLINSSFRLCINNTGVHVQKMQADRAFLNDLKLIRFAITATHPPSEALDSQYPVSSAIRVYHRIFGGFETCLKGRDHIYFAAQGVSQFLPLQVLLTELPDKVDGGYDLKNAAWAFKTFSVSYISSPASLVYFARKGRTGRTPSKRFLGIGNPKLSERPSSGEQAESGVRLSALGDLPETAAELNEASALFEAEDRTVLTGVDATEEAFRSLILSDYNILHFATHGVVPGELDGIDRPALVLTPVNAADRRNDGLLTSREIVDLDLNARLVILSACNSANFDVQVFAGELRGLTDAFILSGADAVVASLWPVESAASKTLMTGLQRLLSENPALAVAKAHSAAARNYFGQQRNPAFFHPRFWGAFIVLGNGGAQVDRPDASDSAIEPMAGGGADYHAYHRAITSLARFWDDVIVLKHGKFNGKRRPSVLSRITLSGDEVWRVDDRDVAAGKILAFDDKIYATGFRSRNGASIPVVRLFDPTGKRLWQKDVHAANGLTSIRAAIPGRSGNLLLASESRNNGKLRQIVFDVSGDGRSERIAALPVPEPGDLLGLKTDIVLSRRGDRIFAVVSYIFDPNGVTGGLFNLPKICSRQSFAVIYEIDLKTKKIVTQHGPIDGVKVTSALMRDGKLIFGGAAQKNCSVETHGFLAEMSEDRFWKALWRDNTPFSSSVETVLQGADGIYAIVSKSRDLDILRSADSFENRPFSSKKSETYRELRFDDFEILRMSPDDPRTVSLFRSVNQVLWIEGGLIDGRSFILHGSNAGNPWWARIKFR